MDKRQQAVQEAGGPHALCSKCRLLDFSYLGFQKANDNSKEKWRLSLTLEEATASAKSCWICGWLVYIADNSDASLASQISVGFDSDRIDPLVPPKLPYSDTNRQTCINRAALWVDRRQAGGSFTYKGFLQRSGVAAPRHVSDMLDSGSMKDTEPYSARLRPAQADMRLFKFWKDYCDTGHGGLCRQSTFMSNRLRTLTSIRLIDVVRGCVVDLDPTANVGWVALSYVWGEAQNHALKKDNFASYHLPGALSSKNMPSTICDAITVTREVGERYLWVDSLCIIQDDDGDKLLYIPSMDIIYGQAIFTIINAASDKVSSGIPGVDMASPRATQDVFEIGRTWLTISLDPQHSSLPGYLQNTRWNTRGWTYQECILSQRCLIFTRDQAYWQCLGGSFCEDISWEQNAPEYPMMYRHCFGKSAVFQTTMRSLFGDQSIDWTQIYTIALEQFLQRQLTSESDRMNALTGILRVLEHSRSQEFFWGMPKSRLELSLSWTGDESLKRNTERQSIGSGGLSSPFPSWSWTGWFGTVNMDIGSVHSLTGTLSLKFYQIGPNGEPVSLHDGDPGGRTVSQAPTSTPAKPDNNVGHTPQYPRTIEHSWMDNSKTEINTSDIPSSIRLSDVAPALLCFWTSTAVLDIHQEGPNASQPGNLNTTISDGKTTIRGFWTWKEPKLNVKQGKFIVVGAAVERPSHGGRPLLNLMLVDQDHAGVCRRRFLVSQVLESSWAKLGNLKWEIVCLG